MIFKQILPDIFLYKGSSSGCVLRSGNRAVLIDCPEMPTGLSIIEELKSIGIFEVERIYLTQYRRAFTGQLWREPLLMSSDIISTSAEAEVLSKAGNLWSSVSHRYHRYHALPDRFLPFGSINNIKTMIDGEVHKWNRFSIQLFEIGAFSFGDACYLVEDERYGKILICGAFMNKGGMLRDIFSLQKALPDMMGYHGHMGGFVNWLKGYDRLIKLKFDCVIGSDGEVDNEPYISLNILREKLLRYAQYYAESSAVRYYFPNEFKKAFENYIGFIPPNLIGSIVQMPYGLQRIGETTSYVLISERNKNCILIDCGEKEVVDLLQRWKSEGKICNIDMCWVTHYHDDHLNAIGSLSFVFGCDIVSSLSVAEVCNSPKGYYLPAESDVTSKIHFLPDGYTWRWNEFQLTALHFPGQSLYHSGLIVEHHGYRVLLCGDAFAPTGLDDYCSGNRNLLGNHRGYKLCLKILERYNIDALINEHQSEAFIYSNEYRLFLCNGMDKKEKELRNILGKDPDFGIDDSYIRVYPFEQTIRSGQKMFQLSLHVTGHGTHTIGIQLVLPDGWSAEGPQMVQSNGLTSGSVFFESDGLPKDISLDYNIFPIDSTERGYYYISADCTIDGDYLGSFAHTCIEVI